MNGQSFDLDVKVTSIKFPRDPMPPNGCFVIFGTDKMTCKGFVPYPIEEGMQLRLSGRVIAWHGQEQFEFRKVSMNIPIDQRALLDYVCEITKGYGPKTAEKIYAEFGDEWQQNLDNMNKTLSNDMKRTLAVLMADRHRTEAIAYAASVGFTARIGSLAFEKWGAGAVAIMKQTPYALAELPRVGFKTVDANRERLGIATNSIARAKAALFWFFNETMESTGNSVVTADEIASGMMELSVNLDIAKSAYDELERDGVLRSCGNGIYTTALVSKHEETILNYIVKTEPSAVPVPQDLASRGQLSFTLDESQKTAINAALNSIGLTVINGGAGTGKTSIIKRICEAFESGGENFDLCSFAGKAAARLREATGRGATTIHSMLGYQGDGRGFTAGSLEGVSVIVDEASMVPSWLLYEIVKRNPKRLILVGDQAQLPPVGIGSPFHDIVSHVAPRVFTLTTCYRNKEAVFKAAAAIREGLVPPNEIKSRSEEFIVERVSGPDAAHLRIETLVKDGEIDFNEDLVLSPRNGDGEDAASATVRSLNKTIRTWCNPHDNGETFKVNDRVMCVKNNSALDIWNGTTGWISRVDIDGAPYFRTDDGNEVKLPKEMRQHIVPAYCMTVHKSQGSQYRDVYILVLRRDKHTLLTRAMFYTAVTRARHKCVVITDDSLLDVIRRPSERTTYLQKLFGQTKKGENT